MDDEEDAKAPAKDPTLALFLGLYLILLAFFVLLNTMATLKEDRVKAVLGSLLSTFSTEILNTVNPTEFTASVGDDLATKEFHREIRDFFRGRRAARACRAVLGWVRDDHTDASGATVRAR